MKKILLLLLCTVTIGLVSCKKDTIVQATNKTVVYDIQPGDWQLSTDGLTYTSVYSNLPEIDNYGLNNEGTQVSISYPDDNGNYTSYIPIPFVYDVDAYSYEVFQGQINLYIQSSDLQAPAPIKPTQKIRVKVIILASENVT